MSLRVWLPLTKDLKNQGLSDVTVTNNGATYSATDGKLGGCYSFDGDDYIDTGYKENFGVGNFSIAAWVKITSSSKTYQPIISNKSTNGASVGCAIYFNHNQNKFLWSTADGSAATEIWTTNTFSDIYDKWIHIVMIRNSSDSRIGYFYINGERQEIASIPAIRNVTNNTYNMIIGGLGTGRSASYYWTGGICDIRLYDHALSPMEVKQISQGLVLHYPLDNNGWGQENILLNTGFQTQYIQSTGWNITKNGTQLASNWGGYNSGVTNASTVYHTHLKQVNGEWIYEYIKTADESWLGISQSGLQSKLTAGKTYTFSWEQYCVEGSNYVTTGLYYYKTGASSAGFHLGQGYGNTNRVLGKWQKFSYTFVAPTDGDYNKGMSWYIYGHVGGNGKMYMRHPKLEKGPVATSWCPNLSDELAATMGMNNGIEYDTSGFKNNGIQNNLPTYSSDTAKYNASIHFNGVNQTIQLPNLTTLISDSIFTFNIWFKRLESEPSSKPWETILGGPSGFELESCSANNVHDAKIKAYSWGGGNFVFEFDKWNMLTMVSNGTNALFYLNGELKLTGTYRALVSGNYFLGSWRDTSTQNYKGYMSDARIYATALSASDIQSLYQNSAYIDSSGNIYGAIHEEV